MDTSAAYSQLAAKCSTTEMCLDDVQKRLDRLDLTEGQRQEVLGRLLDEKYVDESRYAHAFANDKIRFSGWGRVKIGQALRQKHIPLTLISEALDEITNEECLDVLRPLLAAKRRSVRGSSTYEINGKLIRFALGRGFEYELIRQCLDIDDDF